LRSKTMLSQAAYQRRERWGFSSLPGMVAVSLFLHLAGVGLLMFFSFYSSGPVKTFSSAYKVNLVTIPSGRAGQGGGSLQKPAQAATASAPTTSLPQQPEQPGQVSTAQKEEVSPTGKERGLSSETKTLSKVAVVKKESQTPVSPETKEKTLKPAGEKKETTPKVKSNPPPIEPAHKAKVSLKKEVNKQETQGKETKEVKETPKLAIAKKETPKEKTSTPPATEQVQKAKGAPAEPASQKASQNRAPPEAKAQGVLPATREGETTKSGEVASSVPKPVQTKGEGSPTTGAGTADAGSTGTGKTAGDQAKASREGGTPEAGADGGNITLDSSDFPFVYYLRIIEQKISQQWTPAGKAWLSGTTKRVVIGFQVQRNGHISKPVVEESSGIEFLDQTAIRAVLSADPLPPLPAEFGKEYLGVHFGFTLTDNG
jgi:TonB family protein